MMDKEESFPQERSDMVTITDLATLQLDADSKQKNQRMLCVDYVKENIVDRSAIL